MKPRPAKPARWHTCNVVHVLPAQRRLWQFNPGGGGVKLAFDRTLTSAEHLPAKAVAHTLAQPRLNIAWLPTRHVFVRVLELPACPPEELPGTVEFQLEAISPVPVPQAVWTVESVPAPDGKTQSAVLVIASREVVDPFLGELEKAGYQADRLELPQLRELLASEPGRDGVWISARAENERLICLVGWWQRGRLRNVNLFEVAVDPALAGRQLADRLGQLAWAGEVEGWHTPGGTWHLAAEPAIADALVPALQDTLTNAVARHDLLPVERLAALSAGARTTANLLPPDVAIRYRRQFNERLWMRALGVLMAVYAVLVLGGLGWIQLIQFQKRGVDKEIALLGSSYTNALQLKAKVQVLQDQVALKYAGLDCWKAATETLPPELTLTALNFQGRARKLQVFGIVPADQQAMVTAYNEALSKATLNGQPLFAKVSTKSIQAPVNRPATWSIECELFRTDL